jgi:hypothetical protein
MGTELEKRKFQRLEFHLEVAVEIEEAGSASPKGPPLYLKSRNVSHAGLCLETNTLEINAIRLLSGTPGSRECRLRMRIALFPDEAPLEAVGEVCWYDVVREPSEMRYQLGIDFREITNGGKEQLDRFLKSRRNGEGFFQKLFG